MSAFAGNASQKKVMPDWLTCRPLPIVKPSVSSDWIRFAVSALSSTSGFVLSPPIVEAAHHGRGQRETGVEVVALDDHHNGPEAQPGDGATGRAVAHVRAGGDLGLADPDPAINSPARPNATLSRRRPPAGPRPSVLPPADLFNTGAVTATLIPQ